MVPGFNAESSLYRTSYSYYTAGAGGAGAGGTAIVPQVCVNSSCYSVGGGRFCVRLPIVGRVCVNVPSFGRWRIRCCTRWLPPFVSCGISRC